MANKKKKSGPSKYQLKRQKSLAASQLVNNSAILALTAQPSSGTVHATVPLNSNSDLSPSMVLPPQSPCPTHLIPSSSHGSKPQHRGDSPSINHVFVEDWSEDEDPDDEELEYDSAEEEYAGGSKFFTSPVNVTPLVPVASVSVDLPSIVHSPASAQITAIAAPTDTLLPIVVSLVVAQTTPGSFPTRETPALVVSPAPATSAPVGPVNGVDPLATTVIPLTDYSKQAAHVSTPAPSANTVKESIFDRLGPQEDPPVVVCPEGNLPLKSTPILVEPELVSVSGVVDPVSSGWNIVQSKRIRRKTSPPKHRVRPSHVDHCTGPGSAPVHAPMDSRDHRFQTPPTGFHIQPGLNTNVLAGSRYDKGKSVVVSVAPGLPSAGVSSVPLQRLAQPRTGGVSSRGKGLPPTPLS
ncbi:hypothetical protein POTOM_030689 [Populus tomentosa]|uniref:Uncharacterized protein n=1 Tax=Populus tomentosa TaxID=118781 RepID=A0A8X7ZNQ9_POPTO|nr:hypothetical protein POTOM_030689 [Populus tomentosa]